MKAGKAMEQSIINRMTIILQIIERDIEALTSSPNPAILLVQNNYLDAWHTLNKAYHDFVLQRENISALDMLFSRNFAQSYDILRQKMQDIILAQLGMFYEDYNDEICLIYKGDKVIRVSMNEEDEFTKFYSKIIKESDKPFFDLFSTYPYEEEQLDEDGFPTIFVKRYQYDYQPINFENSGLKQLSQTLYVFNRLFSFLVSYKEELIKERPVYFEDIKISVIADYKKYSSNNEKETFRQLKRDAQGFKENRSFQLGPEQWGELLEAEDYAFCLAIKGNLLQNEEKRLSHIDNMIREQMERNGALLQSILNVSHDEELFDFEYANERHIDLYSKLSPENLELFYDLVLRRNIIQCEMYPHIKRQHDAWLEQEMTVNNTTTDVSRDSELSSEPSILTENLRHLFMKPDKFDAYCRVLKGNIKTFIDAQGRKNVNKNGNETKGAKALWDVVNFYSMLYGFFSDKISRENVATVFVFIIPELGEAKSLSASMAKCDIAGKKKLKSYASLPSTDGLKAYEENIGKWIKEIA